MYRNESDRGGVITFHVERTVCLIRRLQCFGTSRPYQEHCSLALTFNIFGNPFLSSLFVYFFPKQNNAPRSLISTLFCFPYGRQMASQIVPD